MDWVAPALGSGLGNRLFQYAAAAGAAEAWGRPVVFLAERCAESPHGALATIFRLFPNVPLLEGPQTYIEYKEPTKQFYTHFPLGPAPKGCSVISGARQTPLYFPTYPLTPGWDNALGSSVVRRMIERDAALTTLEERKRTVSLHVRLGDYLKLPHHQTDLATYYAQALKRVPRGYRLHLFSDQPELCWKLFEPFCRGNGNQYTIAKPRADVESLYEMTLCLGGNITANSTFSWWGAWFAHESGSPWATYPDNWGNGMPEPVDIVPTWGITLSTTAAQN